MVTPYTWKNAWWELAFEYTQHNEQAHRFAWAVSVLGYNLAVAGTLAAAWGEGYQRGRGV